MFSSPTYTTESELAAAVFSQYFFRNTLSFFFRPVARLRVGREKINKKSFFPLALAVQLERRFTSVTGVDDKADEVDSVCRYDHRGTPGRGTLKPLYRKPRLHYLQPRQQSQHQHQQPARGRHMVKATVPFPSNRNSHSSVPVRQFLSHNSSGAALLRLKYSSDETLFRVDGCTGAVLETDLTVALRV